MVELLPECLSSQHEDEDQSKSTKPKCKAVTNVLEWLQCFGIYVAIISCKEPHRVLDLLAYQHLIIQAPPRVSGRLLAGIRPSLSPEGSYQSIHELVNYWSYSVELGLLRQSQLYTLQPLFQHITLILSKDCDLKSNSFPSNRSVICPPPRSQSLPGQAWCPICFDWNESSLPGCPHPSCRFEHISYYCVCNPAMKDKAYKAIFWPNRAFSQGRDQMCCKPIINKHFAC